MPLPSKLLIFPRGAAAAAAAGYNRSIMKLSLLLAVGLLSLLTALTHLFLGGHFIVRPLLRATDLRRVPKVTAYYAWHLVTIVLFTMSGGFFFAAAHPEQRALVIVFAFIAGAASVLNFSLMIYFKEKPSRLIQWIFFVPITILALVAVIA